VKRKCNLTLSLFLLYSTATFACYNNPMRINAGKIKDEDLELSLSHGTITKISEGNYEVRTDRQGTVVLTIKDKKKNNEIERIAFTVK